MTLIPEFWYQRYQENGYEYIKISKKEIPGYEKSEAFLIGRYTMSGAANDVHSKSGQQPLVNTTITDFRNYARAKGNGWQQLDWHYFILQLLYLVEYADYDSKGVLGMGYANFSNTTTIASGGCNELGMKSGTVINESKHSMIYRGIEDIYGNIFQYVDGINANNSQVYVCYDYTQYNSEKFDGCYEPIGYTPATSNGYISKLGHDEKHPLISLPTEVGERGSTYIPGYYWGPLNDSQIAMIGSAYSSPLTSSLWTMSLINTPHDTQLYIGARLLKTI